MFIENFLNLSNKNRIDKKGSNCNIGDIITWFQHSGQKYGIIRKKHPSCIEVQLCKAYVHDFDLHFITTDEIDDVHKNTLIYTRKLMIIKSSY